jgi:c(7)-type cytochrome triheme protein
MSQMNKFWEFPPSPPSPWYGNVLINRVSEKNDRLPVSFSHRLHRVEYTCRVCHFELGFEMKVNSTEVTMEKIKKGEFCGACHNGEIAFSPTRGNCRKCHNGNLSYSDDKFKKLDYLPKSQYRNGIKWTKAIMWGLIKSKESLINPNFKRIPSTKWWSLNRNGQGRRLILFSP